MRAEISALERHLVAAAARRTTITTYAGIAARFLAYVAPRGLVDATADDAEAFLARPRAAHDAAVATRNLEIVALRALFRAHGAADPTAAMRLKRPVRRQPAVPTSSELRRLFEAAHRAPSGARSLAMLALLFQCGLRVAELVRLDVAQLDLAERVLLDVEGKGGTRFDMPLGPEAALLAAAWLVEHPTGEGALFPRGDGHGHVSVRLVQRLLATLRADAGIAKRVTPHSLRHATATQAIICGVDLPTTAAVMRHAHVDTTMGYIALASDSRRAAVTQIGRAIPRGVLPLLDAPGGAVRPVDAEDELCDGG